MNDRNVTGFSNGMGETLAEISQTIATKTRGPLITASRSILPEFNPSVETRAAAIIWSRVLERDLNIRLPIDPLKVINANHLSKVQTGLSVVNPTISFLKTKANAEINGASTTEAVCLSATAVGAQLASSQVLNQALFNHLPEAASTTGRFAMKFGKSMITSNIASAYLDVVPNYFELQQTNSPLVSAIASTVGGLTSFAVGSLGIVLINSSAPAFVSGVGIPLGCAQFSTGSALFIKSGDIGRSVSRDTVDMLNALPHYYEQAVNVINKTPTIIQAANGLVSEKILGLKLIVKEGAELLFNQCNAELFKSISTLSITQKWTHEERQLFGVAVSKEIGNIFPISDQGIEFHPEKIAVGCNRLHRNPKIMKRDLSKCSKQLNVTEQMNKVVLPFLTQLAEGWTDTSLCGFERNEHIVKIYKELEELKNNSTYPQKILAKTIELKNAKAKVICERDNFDAMVKNCGHMIDAAASLSLLTGNKKLATRIQVIGSCVMNIGNTIAGLCGYGTGTGSPMGAVAVLLDTIIKIKSLRGPEIDPTQQMLQRMGAQLQIVQREMHERFDEVMQGLDILSRQQFLNFISLKLDHQTIEEKVDRLQQTTLRGQEELKSYSRTIHDQLLRVLDDKKLKSKRELLLAIRENVNEKVSTVKLATAQGFGAYDQARAKIMSYAGETVGSGMTHSDLIGMDIPYEDIEKLDDNLFDCHPYFHLRTLVNYCDQLSIMQNRIYSPEIMHKKLLPIFHNQRQYQLEKVVTIKEMTDTVPRNAIYRVDSLRTSLESKTDFSFKFVPIFVNARWSLLLKDDIDNQLVYFTLPNNENISRRIIGIAKTAKIDETNIEVRLIQGNVSLQNSHLWLLTAAKEILNKKTFTECVSHISNIILEREYKVDEDERLTADKVPVNNPLVLWYLSVKLLELTYAQHSMLGDASVNISPQESICIQQMIEASESIYQLQAKFSNKDLFEKLITDYKNDLVEFDELVKNEKTIFEKKISETLNASIKELAKKQYYETKDVDYFIKDLIQYNLYGEWYKDGYYDQINSKKAKYTQFHQMRNDTSNVYDMDTTYHNKQAQAVSIAKGEHIKQRTLQFSQLTLNNAYATYGDCSNQKFICPLVVTPNNTALPYLPAVDAIFNLLPSEVLNTIKEANTFALGYFQCGYGTNNNAYIFSINFVISDRVYPIAKLSLSYDPLFYTGKEAIWWSWHGGYYARQIAPSGIWECIKSTSSNAAGNSFNTYASGPSCSYNIGLKDQISSSNLVDILDYKETAVRSDLDNTLATIKQLVVEKKIELKKQFSGELADKFKTTQLKQILQKMNVHYQILKMYVQLVFPNGFDNPQSIIHQLFVRDQSVKNKQSIFVHLEDKPTIFIADALLPCQLLDELKAEVNERLDQTLGWSRLDSVDELQAHLLNCLNKMIPNIVQPRTESEHAQFYGTIARQIETGLDVLAHEIETNPNQFTPQMIAGILRQAYSVTRNLGEQFESKSEVSVPALLSQQPMQKLLLSGMGGTINKVYNQHFFKPREPNSLNDIKSNDSALSLNR